MRFTKQEVWCIFRGEYVKGEPASDNDENEDALFMSIEEALSSETVVATTREILKSVLRADKQTLQKSSFVNKKFDADTWQLFL